MRILLTNIWLKGRTGTEVVTMEMASGLARRGHDVVVFSPEPGPSADVLRRSGIPVTDRLDELTFDPEVIHGNHSIDLVHGLIRFPHTPGVFVCHNPDHWICSPPDLTQIRAYLAVDRICRDRVARELPRVRDHVRIVHNAVDLPTHRLRDPLPARPRRALALTKYSGHLAVLQEACKTCGLELDTLGPGVGDVVDDLPERLQRYDLVFATARMAIEAMAVGCAVVVVDARGLAGLATAETVREWRDDNYGKRILTRPVTVPAIMEDISRYDAADAAVVTADVRAHHALDGALATYEDVYREAAQTKSSTDKAVSASELTRLMRSWLPLIDGISPVAEAGSRLEDLNNRIASLARDLSWCNAELESRNPEIEWRDGQIAALKRDAEGRDVELAARIRDVEWRDGQIAALKRDVEGRDIELAARVRDIEWRDKEIEWREKEIAARDREIQRLSST